MESGDVSLPHTVLSYRPKLTLQSDCIRIDKPIPRLRQVLFWTQQMSPSQTHVQDSNRHSPRPKDAT